MNKLHKYKGIFLEDSRFVNFLGNKYPKKFFKMWTVSSYEITFPNILIYLEEYRKCFKIDPPDIKEIQKKIKKIGLTEKGKKERV